MSNEHTHYLKTSSKTPNHCHWKRHPGRLESLISIQPCVRFLSYPQGYPPLPVQSSTTNKMIHRQPH